MKKYILVTIFALCLLLLGGCNYPLSFHDDAGVRITLRKRPLRIVSLVPSVTEIIAALDADKTLVGITYHSTRPARLARCTIVGGFLEPSLIRIEKLHPDLVFISSLQRSLRHTLESGGCKVVEIETSSLADAYADIELIGRIVGRYEQALQLVEKNRQQLEFVARKIEQIPPAERRRVLRMMGRDSLLVPGDDSFQNDIITAAGGVVPKWGQSGDFIIVDPAQLQAYDPQFIYTCGNRQEVLNFFKQPQFSEIAAVREHKIIFFPCALTCRAANHIGDFVEWLAASIYPDYFSRPENMVRPAEVNSRTELSIDLEYVNKAEVVELTIADFRHRTLVVDLAEPMPVLSTLEGFRTGITSVGNHYLPPPTWNLVHRIGVEKFDRQVAELIDRRPETTALLFTGADMRNLVQKRATFKKMRVVALVTAGVCSNALRMSVDKGGYYELQKLEATEKPGTINIIILTNTHLTPRAMSRALIGACEGKTAALQDLDIRSSVSPVFSQATGTGTDNIIVVSGRGPTVKNAGGHSKMGELIARVVYDGVVEAIHRQNSICAGRSIFQRLQERGITIYDFVKGCRTGFTKDEQDKRMLIADLTCKVEQLLLESHYSSFVESSLVLSDAFNRGQVKNLASFREECIEIVHKISGKTQPCDLDIYKDPKLPAPLALALESLVCGTKAKLNSYSKK
jgi:ABC-type Fe3+-hydroxamate transport system substrate-binding protein/adenosylcobinamide amidohydrolase